MSPGREKVNTGPGPNGVKSIQSKFRTPNQVKRCAEQQRPVVTFFSYQVPSPSVRPSAGISLCPPFLSLSSPGSLPSPGLAVCPNIESPIVSDIWCFVQFRDGGGGGGDTQEALRVLRITPC